MAQNLAETNIQPSQSENLEQLSFSPTFPSCLARMKRKTSSYGKPKFQTIQLTGLYYKKYGRDQKSFIQTRKSNPNNIAQTIYHLVTFQPFHYICTTVTWQLSIIISLIVNTYDYDMHNSTVKVHHERIHWT